MPDDVDARSADGKGTDSEKHLPDIVGEELADGARIWRVYDRVTHEEDKERIGNWNRGLDNLALFAGLFSAVTTAFIIEAHQDTEPDYARLTFLVLNSSAAGIAFKDEPFTIDPIVRITYCLWIASLILSLTAALIAIMGKDWIGMYASRPVCNPRQWAEIRTYRLACVERWYMSGVIASAPVLLHISLVLFTAGLVLFVAPDPLCQRVALGLSLAAGGLYLVTVLSAIVFPTSPFRSPATQAFRGAVTSVFSSLYNRVVYPPKRRPIALLQQATLIIGAALSHPLPATVLHVDRSQRRRLRGGELITLWDRLLSQNPFHAGHSWRDMPTLLVGALRAHIATLLRLISGHLRSTMDAYNYRWQRPRTKPWHASVRIYLRRLDLSDRWAEVRNEPTPALLAHSLSHLNETTQSMDVFHAILVALGDIAIGRNVAPLVSSDLKSRLAMQIRHNAPTADLVTLSRFVLADRHLSDTPTIGSWVIDRFTRLNKAPGSESAAFALVEVHANSYLPADDIDDYFPDTVTQPRALLHLLPIVTRVNVLVILARRYWDPARDDNLSINLEDQLRRRMFSFLGGADQMHGFQGPHGLVELLIYIIENRGSAITPAAALIIKVLDADYLSRTRERPCLVFAFGCASPEIADDAWAALSSSEPFALHRNFLLLMQALPLEQFGDGMERTSPPISYRGSDFDMCCARAIIQLLWPSRYFCNVWRFIRGWPSTLELCVRCLHTHVGRLRSSLNSKQRLEIIALLLDKSVLIRVSTLWEQRRGDVFVTIGTERDVIKILTGIARQMTVLLVSRHPGDYDTGTRLFCLFSFSSSLDSDGQPVAWDLGSYLRTASARLSEQSPGTDISMGRLLKALRALRPLCVPRDVLRAAWQRIKLSPDPEYRDYFWDDDDFTELGTLLSPDAPFDGGSLQEHPTLRPAPEAFGAHDWLDASMH